jgi:hypothetical protein
VLRAGRQLGSFLGLLLLGAGCGRVRQVRECQQAVGAVNSALDAIRPLVDRTHDVSALRTIADRYDALSKHLAAEKPADKEVATSVSELSKLFKAAGEQVRALSDAIDRKQRGEAFVARHRLEELTRRERAEAYRLDGVCRGP